MRRHLDSAVAQAMTWIWLGIIFVGVLVWLGYRYWRSRRPPQSTLPKPSYSKRLGLRLAKTQGAAKHKRRGNPKGHGHRR